jgi:hypothetical protein
MKTKELYKMINEEASEFDFLGMNNVDDEKTHNDLLDSKEFQTNLVNDIINNKNDKDKFTNFSSTYVNKNTDMYNDVEIIELEIEPTYVFEGKDYHLIFFLSGNNDEKINFKNFNIKIFSKAGDQIKMEWVEKNEDLYEAFIESLISPFLD